MTGPLFPENYSKIWIRGRFITMAGVAVRGKLTLAPAVTGGGLVNRSLKLIMSSASFSADTDNDGYVALQVPATNDPDITPINFTYAVTTPIGQKFSIVVPYDTTPLNSVGDPLHGQPVIELIDMVPVGSSGGVGQLLRGIGIQSMVDNGAGGLLITYTDLSTTTIAMPDTVAGPPGPAGPTGPVGPTGPTGATGPAGGGATKLVDLTDVTATGATEGQPLAPTAVSGGTVTAWGLLPVRVLRGTGSGDDTTRINAALAGGGNVQLVGAFTVSAPLRIPSDTTLDATDATVTLASASNCNLLQNMAVQNNRRILDADMTSGSATLTSATAAFVSGDVGKTVVVQGAGAAGSNLTATVSTVTDATTVTLSAAATTTVDGQYAVIGTGRDRNVRVIGGHWIRSTNNNARDATHRGWNSNTFRFRHLDGLEILRPRFTNLSGKYACNAGDVTNFLLDRVTAVFTESDLVHINGPARDGVIRDTFSAGSGDDIVSLTGGDFMVLDSMGDTGGSITNVAVTGIRTYKSVHAQEYTRALCVVAGQTPNAVNQFEVSRLTVRGIDSEIKANPVAIGADTQDVGTTGGSYSDILIDGVVNRPPASGAPTQVVLLRDGAMTNIELRAVRGVSTFRNVQIGVDAVINGLKLVGIDPATVTNAGSVAGLQVIGHTYSYGAATGLRVETMDRRISTGTPALISGAVYLTYFRPARELAAVSQIKTITRTTAAAGTTLARVGLYSVNADGSLTLLGASAASTTLWNTVDAPHNATLTSTVAVDPLKLYAVGLLFVGTTPPALSGVLPVIGEENTNPDRLGAAVTGQTDLPSSITLGSLGNASRLFWAKLIG